MQLSSLAGIFNRSAYPHVRISDAQFPLQVSNNFYILT